jgi:hypothetical protein
MKRKHTALFAAAVICVVLIASCTSEMMLVAPNPGFGLVTIGLDSNGIVHPLVGARTTGHLFSLPDPPFSGQPIIPAGATGTVREFDVTSNWQSKAIVPNGVAPAFWTVKGEEGWTFIDGAGFFGPPRIASCIGKIGVITPKRGEFNDLECRPDIGVVGPILFPRSINVTESAVEIQMGGEGVATTYGMPTIQFYDMYGTYVAQTTATSIDTDYGQWAKGWSGCLAGMPAGTYRLDLINGTADGYGERVGMGHIYLYGATSTNYIDDNQFFVAQQYRDFLNREPDQNGLNFWTGVITQCSNVNYRQAGEAYADCIARKRVDLGLAFWASMEFQQLHPEIVNPSGSPAYDNSQFVRLCHVLYLQREPSEADQDFWMGNLVEANNDYGRVIKAFINSDEYRLRFEPPPDPGCNPTPEDISNCEHCCSVYAYWDYSSCGCIVN